MLFQRKIRLFLFFLLLLGLVLNVKGQDEKEDRSTTTTRRRTTTDLTETTTSIDSLLPTNPSGINATATTPNTIETTAAAEENTTTNNNNGNVNSNLTHIIIDIGIGIFACLLIGIAYCRYSRKTKYEIKRLDYVRDARRMENIKPLTTLNSMGYLEESNPNSLPRPTLSSHHSKDPGLMSLSSSSLASSVFSSDEETFQDLVASGLMNYSSRNVSTLGGHGHPISNLSNGGAASSSGSSHGLRLYQQPALPPHHHQHHHHHRHLSKQPPQLIPSPLLQQQQQQLNPNNPSLYMYPPPPPPSSSSANFDNFNNPYLPGNTSSHSLGHSHGHGSGSGSGTNGHIKKGVNPSTTNNNNPPTTPKFSPIGMTPTPTYPLTASPTPSAQAYLSSSSLSSTTYPPVHSTLPSKPAQTAAIPVALPVPLPHPPNHATTNRMIDDSAMGIMGPTGLETTIGTMDINQMKYSPNLKAASPTLLPSQAIYSNLATNKELIRVVSSPVIYNGHVNKSPYKGHRNSMVDAGYMTMPSTGYIPKSPYLDNSGSGNNGGPSRSPYLKNTSPYLENANVNANANGYGHSRSHSRSSPYLEGSSHGHSHSHSRSQSGNIYRNSYIDYGNTNGQRNSYIATYRNSYVDSDVGKRTSYAESQSGKSHISGSKSPYYSEGRSIKSILVDQVVSALEEDDTDDSTLSECSHNNLEMNEILDDSEEIEKAEIALETKRQSLLLQSQKSLPSLSPLLTPKSSNPSSSSSSSSALLAKRSFSAPKPLTELVPTPSSKKNNNKTSSSSSLSVKQQQQQQQQHRQTKSKSNSSISIQEKIEKNKLEIKKNQLQIKINQKQIQNKRLAQLQKSPGSSAAIVATTPSPASSSSSAVTLKAASIGSRSPTDSLKKFSFETSNGHGHGNTYTNTTGTQRDIILNTKFTLGVEVMDTSSVSTLSGEETVNEERYAKRHSLHSKSPSFDTTSKSLVKNSTGIPKSPNVTTTTTTTTTTTKVKKINKTRSKSVDVSKQIKEMDLRQNHAKSHSLGELNTNTNSNHGLTHSQTQDGPEDDEVLVFDVEDEDEDETSSKKHVVEEYNIPIIPSSPRSALLNGETNSFIVEYMDEENNDQKSETRVKRISVQSSISSTSKRISVNTHGYDVDIIEQQKQINVQKESMVNKINGNTTSAKYFEMLKGSYPSINENNFKTNGSSKPIFY